MPHIVLSVFSRRGSLPRLAVVLVFACLGVSGGSPALASTDAPDTCAAAALLPISTWHDETLSTAGDVDWFTFEVTHAKWSLITLGNLGADYRLDLYGACGHFLASSNRSGVQYEEIYRKLPVGTYHVRVESAAGTASPDDYALRVRLLRTGVYVLSSSGWDEFPNEPRIAGEILNNTAQDRESVKIQVRFYDESNNLLAVHHTWARADRLGAHARSMFVWADLHILGYDHYSVRVVSAPLATVPAFSAMTVTYDGSTPDGYGGVTFHGTLVNPTGRHIGNPRAMLTLYDSLGRVVNTDFTDPAPNPIAPHASTPFDIYLSDRNTGNRRVFTTYGDPRNP